MGLETVNIGKANGQNGFQIMPPRYDQNLAPLSKEQLTKQQSALLSAFERGEHVLFMGPAGSGKTQLILSVLNAVAQRGDSAEVWALAPNRARAEYLSQSPVRRQWSGPRLFQTPAAVAFRVVTHWAVQRRQPYPQPQLMTGPEEETRLINLLQQVGQDWEWPVEIGENPAANPYFIKEVRNLLATCAHWGVDEFGLHQLGELYRQPQWQVAAKLITHYQPTFQEGKWDSAALVQQAFKCLQSLPLAKGPAQCESQENVSNLQLSLVDSDLLQDQANPDELLSPFSLPHAIILDDLQDCPAGVARLLAAFAVRGTQLVVSSNPEVSVEGFRGAFPDNLEYLSEHLKTTTITRLSPRVFSEEQLKQNTLTRPVGLTSPAAKKAPKANREQTFTPGKICLAKNQSQQFDQLAEQLMAWRLQKQISWSQMAVITRNRQQLETLRMGLEIRDIPLAPPSRAIQFNHHPATRPLLEAFSLVAQFDHRIRSQRVQNLLQSPLFQVNSLVKARLDRCIAVQWAARPQPVDWLYANLGTDELPAVHFQDDLAGQNLLNACAQTLAKAAHFWENPGNPHTQLWEVWQASGAQIRWQRAAMDGDETADDYLDAVIALFKNCQVWVELNPHGNLREYLQYLADLNHPQDTLGSRAQRAQGVSLLTASGAGGQRFEAVIVAGLQEGAWPNTMVRDWMLGASLLHDLQRGREVVTASNQLLYDRAARVKETVKDEAALLASALTRANRYLLVSLLDGSEQSISGFARILASRWKWPLSEALASSAPVSSALGSDPGTPPETSAERSVDGNMATVPASTEDNPQPPQSPVTTLRRLVAQLRAKLVQDKLDPQQRQEILETLVFLMANGVEEANPASWRYSGQGWEQALAANQLVKQDWWSDLSASVDADSDVYLRPSTIESVRACPLEWFLTSNGANSPLRSSQNLGTLVHLVAQEKPDAPLNEKLEYLEELWAEERETWLQRRYWDQAVEAVTRLHNYLEKQAYPGLVEADLKVQIQPGLKMFARLDRLENTGNGLRIVDFKTASPSNRLSQLQVYAHEQLLAYQLGLTKLLENPDLVGADLQAFLAEATDSATAVEALDTTPTETATNPTPVQASVTNNRGAALAFVCQPPNSSDLKAGHDPEGPTLRYQKPLTDGQLAQEEYRLEVVGKIIREKNFPAFRGPKCRFCALKSSCPLTGKGEQVL